jgi:hypothetical protein
MTRDRAGCADLERVLAGEAPPELGAAFDEHARQCPACARELREWAAISAAAPALKKSWASPGLWPAIEQRMNAAVQGAPPVPLRPRLRRWVPALAAAAAAAAMAIFSTVADRSSRTSATPPRAPGAPATLAMAGDPLLSALDTVEAAEGRYRQSIDELARLASQQVAAAPGSPLALAYREKLALLDAAIAEVQAGIAQNRYNAYLRRELLAIYRQKQQTLEDLMRDVR